MTKELTKLRVGALPPSTGFKEFFSFRHKAVMKLNYDKRMTKKKEYRGSIIPILITGVSSMISGSIGLLHASDGTHKNTVTNTILTLLGAALTAFSIKRIYDNEALLEELEQSKSSPSVEKVEKNPDDKIKNDWVARTISKQENSISR